ncbi:RHS repeat-associated core domain-containing protein [Burkholderia sp. 22PA0099]|uniref:RHS repeat-associated core domain-containing protein n=1 Tax=Burkholderia sp. 22PA0099 TaxID=3237372 RepID=UPI0039C47FE2
MLGGVGGDGQPTATASVVAADGSSTPLGSNLNVARIYQAAVVLPDGSVLVIGGIDGSGLPVMAAERLNLQTRVFTNLGDIGLVARSHQTVTVMADGRLLIAGGVDAHGNVLAQSELLDATDLKVSSTAPKLKTGRSDAQAALLPSGDVMVQGGSGAHGRALGSAELFDVTQNGFIDPASDPGAIPAQSYEAVSPAVQSALPTAGATDVAVSARLSLLFNKPLDPSSLNVKTVTLVGPQGAVEGSVTATDDGILAFFVPKVQLLPATHYTLFVKDAKDAAGNALPFTTIAFTTQSLNNGGGVASGGTGAGSGSVTALPDSSSGASSASVAQIDAAASASTASDPSADTPSDDDSWSPGAKHRHGRWTNGKSHLALRTMPKNPEIFAALYGRYGALKKQAPHSSSMVRAGVTAVEGQVLKLNGKPLRGASLSIGSKTVVTDDNGEFILDDVPSGQQDLIIDGSSANHGKRQYGRFEYGMSVTPGKVNALPFVIWMTPLDTNHVITIPSPTTGETDISNPAIPGLELKIPAGTVIRDDKGNIVTKLTMSAIPVDQPPFPLPPISVPVYFTIQPGGAHLQAMSSLRAQGAQLIYPNFNHEQPNARIDFWNYDPTGKGWYVYGKGTVSADGTQIVPDPGIVIYEFTGAMVGGEPEEPSDAQPPCGGCNVGDPVDAYTGIFTLNRTDLRVADVIPLEVTRTYRTRDNVARSFGIGTTLSYDMFLVRDVQSGWSKMSLVLPNGSHIDFTEGEAGFYPLVAKNTASSQFYGATLGGYLHGPCPSGFNAYWCVTLKDGTIYGFPEAEGTTNPRQGALTLIQDRHGNTVQLQRDQYANLTQVISPNGRHLYFTYDGLDRMTSVSDDLGRKVQYQYDQLSRLTQVIDPAGHAESYTYDSANEMLAGTNKNRNLEFQNTFDASGRVVRQSYADGSAEGFSYDFNASSNSYQTIVTDPRGVKQQISFNSSGYATSEVVALGRPEQQAITYTRDIATNRVVSIVDALGRNTSYQYDNMGNVTSITNMSGTAQARHWSYQYDSTYNQIVKATDPIGNSISLTLNNQGDVVASTDSNGNHVVFLRDQEGRETARSVTVDGGTMTIARTYSGADLTSVSDSLGRAVTLTYDSVGRAVQAQDPKGNSYRAAYDTLDHVISTTDPAGNVTYKTYDYFGNVKSIVSPMGGAWLFAYDEKERLISEKDENGKSESYEYDASDNKVCIVDRRGEASILAYDGVKRLYTIGFGASNCNATTSLSNVQNTWDAANRLTVVNDSAYGTITRTYDDFDKLTQEVTPNGTIAYTYYANGLRDTATVNGQAAVTYQWDAANRLTKISQGISSIGFAYNAANFRIGLAMSNGIAVSYNYDLAGQLLKIKYSNASGVIDEINYLYDSVGRRSSINESMPSNALMPSSFSATKGPNSVLASINGGTVEYDANGNIASNGAASYGWNERNRLSSVAVSGNNVAQYQYDIFGRRVAKFVNGSQTRFMYDGLQVVQENNAITGISSVLAGVKLDEYFQRSSSAGVRSFMQDALGSVVGLLDESGATQTKYNYSAFGDVAYNGSVSDNPYQFIGRENDGDGLLYVRARYLLIGLGRFASQDPYGFVDGANLYAYALDDPINFNDPMGLDAGAGDGGEAGLGGPTPSAGMCAPNNPNNSNNPNIINVQFVWGHGDRHVPPDDQESARNEILNNMPDPNNIGGPFWGRSDNYEYRVFPLGNGRFNIGTHYPL